MVSGLTVDAPQHTDCGKQSLEIKKAAARKMKERQNITHGDSGDHSQMVTDPNEGLMKRIDDRNQSQTMNSIGLGPKIGTISTVKLPKLINIFVCALDQLHFD